MTAQRKYFGTDGIRGKIGSSLINPEFVLKLGWAVGRVREETERVLRRLGCALVEILGASGGETGVEAGGQSIPPVRLPSWSQKRTEDIPRGYVGHEDLANGVRLGKSDPGPQWDWDHFLSRVRHWESGADDRGLLRTIHQMLADYLGE